MSGLFRMIVARLGGMVSVLVGTVLITAGVLLAVAFGFCRVYVQPGYCAVWIAKSGDAPPADALVVEPGQKGIQRATSGPGRYFFNPVMWEHKLVELETISAGSPDTWTWVHTVSKLSPSGVAGRHAFGGDLPEVGILIRKTGKPHPEGRTVVNRVEADGSRYKGIIRQVLTPGTYRINPYEYDVQKIPATVIPAGFVGVVTNQIGVQPDWVEVPDVAIGDAAAGPEPGSPPRDVPTKRIRPLAAGDQRGTLRDVLPPGVYYINPNVERVKVIEVGFNEFSQLAAKQSTDTIRFPSESGFDIELGVTVVWGLHPKHAAEVINEFGATDEVLEKVIKPQLRSICRNQGSLYEARDFIQGDKREEFQQVLTTTLRDVCARKNIELLLALISTIEVFNTPAGSAGEGTDLRTEIQDTFIAREQQITNVKLQETAKKKALLEEAKKKVDIARETVQAETRKKVETTLAEGRRKAAETEAQGRLQVASIQQQVAMLSAQQVELLGRAEADVEKLKKQADADGKKMLVDAFGSGAAYNLYTFAEHFEPESIRMIFAGPGTFWTDLRRFEELGAAEILKDRAGEPPGEIDRSPRPARPRRQ